MLRHQQTIETTPKFSNHHGRTISPSMNQQCFGDGQEMSVSKLDVFFSVYVFLPKILRSLNLLLHISLHPSKKLDDGWPESVEEQSLLLLVWRHYITR